jgi:predicted DNA-binding transcriptional regulator AlpA
MEIIEQLIPRRKGYKIVGVSVSTGQRRERDDPDFPKPVLMGPGRFGFKLSELQSYINTRPAAVRGPRPVRAIDAQKAARERRQRIRELEAELARERHAAEQEAT